MPAAAVIPAPIAYIKVVAVKKLVVEFLRPPAASAARCDSAAGASSARRRAPSLGRVRSAVFYCEKIRVFKAGFSLEYISME